MSVFLLVCFLIFELVQGFGKLPFPSLPPFFLPPFALRSFFCLVYVFCLFFPDMLFSVLFRGLQLRFFGGWFVFLGGLWIGCVGFGIFSQQFSTDLVVQFLFCWCVGVSLGGLVVHAFLRVLVGSESVSFR